MRRSNVWTNVIVIVFLLMFVLGCTKYDKISVLGTWEIDIKAAKGLPDTYEFARETMIFSSSGKYTQNYEAKVKAASATATAKWERWTVKGDIERKKDHITFKNRVKDGNDKQEDVTYPYTIKENNEKFTIIIENADFPKNEKIYTKVSSGQ
jgi:hypothetical protein